MKIIFLDIDGVLNGYGWFEHFIVDNLFRICRFLGFAKEFKDHYDLFGIRLRYVRNLKRIINKTKAKVVLSSSWKFGWYKPYEDCSERMKALKRAFTKYNIEVVGITPYDLCSTRGEEINKYLKEHYEDITSFVIIDDEDFDINEYFPDNIIKTRNHRIDDIKGRWQENTGLKRRYIKPAVKILNNEEIYIQI